MKRGDKEFYEIMGMFEMNAKSMFIPQDFRRENNSPPINGVYYCNGAVNTAFIGFLHGYEAARCTLLMGIEQ